MLSWCCGMVESFVICGCYKYTLLASTKFNLTVSFKLFCYSVGTGLSNQPTVAIIHITDEDAD